jgi:zinc finger protein ZFPM1
MIDEPSLIPENIIPVKIEDKMDFLLDEKASPESITIDDHRNSPSESNSSTLEKYCSNCDIVFTYENTFLAHKKFYCKSIKSDNKSPNTNVTVSLAEASAL